MAITAATAAGHAPSDPASETGLAARIGNW
jgi:hypothetical protein